MFAYLRETYRFMGDISEANIHVSEATRKAYAYIVESLNAHSDIESLENVRSEVQAAYDDSVTRYHAVKTGMYMRDAVDAMMIYQFFMLLTDSHNTELLFK